MGTQGHEEHHLDSERLCTRSHTSNSSILVIPLIIRCLIVIIMNGLIRTSSWRLIQVVPQVDIHQLVLAHIPSAYVRPLDAGNRPGESITLPREGSVRVLCL